MTLWTAAVFLASTAAPLLMVNAFVMAPSFTDRRAATQKSYRWWRYDFGIRTRRPAPLSISRNSNDTSSGPSFFYNDFDDTDGEGDQTERNYQDFVTRSTGNYGQTMSGLTERIQQLRKQMLRKQHQLLHHWQTGIWQSRGFAVDQKDDGTVISCLAVVPVEEHIYDTDVVWLGRSDGSVVAIELGSDTWTQIRTRHCHEDYPTVNDPYESETIPMFTKTGHPCRFLHRLSTGGRPIVAIEPFEEYLFVSARGSRGDIQVWTVPENASRDGPSSTPRHTSTLSGVHSADIAFLQVIPWSTIMLQQHGERRHDQDHLKTPGPVLLSVATDGTIALWDGSIPKCHFNVQFSSKHEKMRSPTNVVITSADANESYLFLGTATGQVWVYALADLVATASKCKDTRSFHPQPVSRWQATLDNVPITAIKVGNEPIHDGTFEHTIKYAIVTGDAKGVVKLWELIQATSSSGETIIDYWPQSPIQRLAADRKVHILSQGCMLDSNNRSTRSISRIALHPHTVIVSDVTGAIIAWNSQTGKESFQVPGVRSRLSSLLLLRDSILISDGMQNAVCVQDFDCHLCG